MKTVKQSIYKRVLIHLPLLIAVLLVTYFSFTLLRQIDQLKKSKVGLEKRLQELQGAKAQGRTEGDVSLERADDNITFTNSRLNYSIVLPKNTNINHLLDDEHNKLVDLGIGKYNLEIHVYTDSDWDVSKQGYLEARIGGEEIIDGVKAYRYSSPGYCDGPGCSEPFVGYGLKHNNKIFQLVFPGEEKINPEITSIVKQFKFLAK